MPTKKAIKQLLDRRHDLIPGAAHTYGKGDDQWPANAPKAILRGKGAYLFGDDGKKYLDWGMGLKTVTLGHCYSAVNKAVAQQMKLGTNFSRPSLIEFEFADLLTKILPHVEMVKFAKNGSTVTTAAVKLARAFTGRKYVALCSDHPFFSYDDWFIGTTPCNSGIPKEIKDLSLTFRYNDIKSLEKLFKEYPGQIACVILEAVATEEPKDDFLKKAEKLTKANQAVFIIDEMITGFRLGLGGACQLYGLTPDLVTYGKGIANGYSMAVVGGRKEIMELGGIKHKKPKVFLVSTTHGAETISVAAAIATIKEIKSKNVPKHLWRIGDKLKRGLELLVRKHGLEKSIEVMGLSLNMALNFRNKKGEVSSPMKTIFLQEVVKRGLMFSGYIVPSYSHGDGEIEKTLKIVDQSLVLYKKAFEDDNPEKYLLGEAVKPVFRAYN